MPLEDRSNLTLSSFLSHQAQAHADRPATEQGDRVITYSDLADQAGRLAAGLQSLGLKAGDRLAVILPNVVEYPIVIFAAAQADLVLVPINVRRSPDEVLARLRKTRPRAIITFADPGEHFGPDHSELALAAAAELADLEHGITIEGPARPGLTPLDDLLSAKASPPVAAARPTDPAAIIHTLGSSGDPRGAVLTHRGLIGNALAMARRLQATPEDVFLGAVPFSNTFGLTATILTALSAGASLACLPRFSAEHAGELLASRPISIFNAVPTMYALLLNHGSHRVGGTPHLRSGIVAGAPCPPELVERIFAELNCRVLLAYGLTEASPCVTCTHIEDGSITASRTVGRPLPGVEIKLVDSGGYPIAAGLEGELCVRGDNVMAGYWDDPAASAQVLDAEGWLHTGDLATIDPDGNVQVIGRQDDVIIRGGFKVYPQTIEMVLRTHPLVREAVVVGVPDLIYGELICACVVLQRPDVNSEDLRAFAAERLADYSAPDRVHVFKALPRRGSGVVHRNYLSQLIRIRGRAWVFGKNIDTDAIIPARRCNTADPRELALYCMEDADPEFIRHMQRGDLIVADSNFGCGSSREVAPLAIKAAGVSAVIAASFARIFFRNAINIGLPILECPSAAAEIQPGDDIEVEPATGTIHNLTNGKTYRAAPFPDFLQQIIDKGGLLAYVEERLAETRTPNHERPTPEEQR
ncbi:MAG: AMP-binding protein [Chloroflexi bacterium]|nr:AMP-binding protein [Chloroflexota bacterium]